jgi:hypothetical protein
MIRILIESALVFLLPAALYVSFAVLRRQEQTSIVTILNRAPIFALCLLGAAMVLVVMVMFGNVGDGKPGQAYEPAVFKDGKVIPGRMK